MRKNEFEENWHVLRGKIQERWAKFTHDEISKINGNYERFLKELQKKYGYSKEHAQQEMRNWHENRAKQRKIPKLAGEETPAERLSHEELAHEDKDPIYPIEISRDEWDPNQGSKKQSDWRKKSEKTKEPSLYSKGKKKKAS